MSEPLTREERQVALRHSRGMGEVTRDIDRYEATVQAVEAERDAARAKVARAQDVLDDAWIRLSPDAETALKEALR